MTRDDEAVEHFTRDDLTMRVRRLEAQSAAAGENVVVLVHGIGTSSRYFTRLAEDLSGSATVISVDLPGFGPNRRPRRQLAVEDFGTLLADYFTDAGLVSPVLVGHSMGAEIVVDAALRHPVSGVTLIGPVVDERARSAWRQGMRLFRDTFHETPGANWIVFSDYLRSGIRWFFTELPAMLAYRTEEHLPLVQAPVLIIRGDRDPVAPQGWVESLGRQGRFTRVVSVPGGGHVVQHTQSAAVAAEIRLLISGDSRLTQQEVQPAYPSAFEDEAAER